MLAGNMANLDEESLFSLELIVDELSILPNVSCRFPSVAFRLLDFPTLVIHHVEIDHARTIRARIAAESRYKPPFQFSELQDGNGKTPEIWLYVFIVFAYFTWVIM